MTEQPSGDPRADVRSQILALTDPVPLVDAMWRVYGAERDERPIDWLAGLSVDITTINAALRNFDGSDWDSLARRLLGVSERSAAVAVVTPAVVVATGQAIGEGKVTGTATTLSDTGRGADSLIATKSNVDWWSDWLRTRAAVLAALYFTCSVSAEEIWPDLVANLRDNAIAAIALYGAYVAWEVRRKDR